MSRTVKFFLLRHGSPEISGALLGSTDCNVTEAGLEQMEQASHSIADQVDYIVTSPLSRCKKFSELFSNRVKKPLFENQGLRECHFGDWDGLIYQDIHKQFSKHADAFFSDPLNHTPPNGEDLTTFHNRVVDAFGKIPENYLDLEKTEQKVLVVTHAGVIRSLVAWALNMDFRKGNQFQRFDIEYGSLTEITLYSLATDNQEHSRKWFSKVNRLNWQPNTLGNSQ